MVSAWCLLSRFIMIRNGLFIALLTILSMAGSPLRYVCQFFAAHPSPVNKVSEWHRSFVSPIHARGPVPPQHSPLAWNVSRDGALGTLYVVMRICHLFNNELILQLFVQVHWLPSHNIPLYLSISSLFCSQFCAVQSNSSHVRALNTLHSLAGAVSPKNDVHSVHAPRAP